MSYRHYRSNRKYDEPTERYTPDGRLVKNESPRETREDIPLKEILRRPDLREEFLKEARESIAIDKDALRKEDVTIESESDEELWSKDIEDRFFSYRPGSESFITRGDDDYFAFREFFVKYKSHRKIKLKQLAKEQPSQKRLTKSAEELKSVKYALVLFDDFKRKKDAATKEKIQKDRAALPIAPFKDAILTALRRHRVILVAGDTGCGKSTQVPQYLMEAGVQKIACTQPRRIACFSLAKRVGYETMKAYGSQIGYQAGTKSNKTRILFLTEGLLLRQYASDNWLAQYDVIIVDEVHERHLMGDFLLGVLKQLLRDREDIYIVLMSATINSELFSKYFDAPTITIPGKMYEVEILYRPHNEEDINLIDDKNYKARLEAEIKYSIPAKSDRIDSTPYLKIMEQIDQTYSANERGDLLIFMSGINEISQLAEEVKLYASYTKRWIVLMLHSSLSVEEQEKVFDIVPEGIRKCIISSNIAETSVTIDGIRFIIDSGRVKELGHDEGLHKLSEFWISKASAKQRAGRAGRTGPGICYRLYSEREYQHLNDFAIPEILRVPVEPIVLQLKALDLGDPRDFDYVERPPTASIESSIKFLQMLGALDDRENLTALGRVLSNLPIDVILGKMLVMATVFDLIEPVVTIAAALNVQSPFIRLGNNPKPEIIQNRRTLDSSHGDPFTLLNVWQEWVKIKADRSESSRSWCKRHGVEEQRLYEITKLKRQFEDIMGDAGLISQENNRREQERERMSARDKRKRKEQQHLLRRQKYIQKSSKRRKILKFQEEGEEERDDTDLEHIDIRDLEFNLSHDAKSLREKSTSALASEKDINVLKLILCSGLYPQLAVEDEHNEVRKMNEQIFHTKTKRFLNIHPTSVFYANPDWLVSGRGSDTNDELLAYVQLLETNKPYLVNIMRVPTVHTSLLFGRSIDTNADCSLIIVDDYLVLRFRGARIAEKVLVITYQLRKLWGLLVERKLESSKRKASFSTSKRDTVGDKVSDDILLTMPPAIQKIYKDEWLMDKYEQEYDEDDFSVLSEELSRKLAGFMDSPITCETGRAKASELLLMFPQSSGQASKEEEEPTIWDSEKVVKHGVQITSYLRWNSVHPSSLGTRSSADSVTANKRRDYVYRSYWHCEKCNSDFTFNQTEIEEHTMRCGKEENKSIMDEDENEYVDFLVDKLKKNVTEHDEGKNEQGKNFHCDICGKDYSFSPIEILRHKKSCQLGSK